MISSRSHREKALPRRKDKRSTAANIDYMTYTERKLSPIMKFKPSFIRNSTDEILFWNEV
jgi:hypothetical protein